MRDSRSFLELLCCPVCRGDLSLDAVGETAPDGHVMQGALKCGGCSARYPITNGVPRLIAGSQAADVASTTEGFGYQWQRANTTVMNSRLSTADLFLDFIQPITPDYFAGKLILDGGCGQARFTRLAQAFGAQAVVGVDLSDSVHAAFANTRSLPNVLIIQADLLNLPLRPCFDYVFSVGVIHHTSDPRRAFGNLAACLKLGGGMSAWVYGREHNGWIIHVLNPIREKITSRLPRRLLWLISAIVTVPMYLLIKLLYLPTARVPALSFLKRLLPYFDYLSWLGKYCGFSEQALVVFDHLSPAIAQYTPYDEFASWFRENALGDVVITSRAGNSWRGFGVRTARPAQP